MAEKNDKRSRIRPSLRKIRELDEEKLRDRAIIRLKAAMDLAYKIVTDERLDLKSRQSWLKTYTEASRVFIQALKAREEKDWQKQLEEIREYRRKAAMQLESESSRADLTHQPAKQEQA